MKAYVIKLDNGKYLSKYHNYDYSKKIARRFCYTDKIENAKIFKEPIKLIDEMGCKCVEIRIEESDNIRNQIFDDIYTNLLDIRNPYWQTRFKDGLQYMTAIDIYNCLEEILDKIEQGEKQ